MIKVLVVVVNDRGKGVGFIDKGLYCTLSKIFMLFKIRKRFYSAYQPIKVGNLMSSPAKSQDPCSQ